MKAMKKFDVVTIIFVGCLFCIANGSLIGCKQAGLGPAVDMTGPTLEITSPNYMDNVRSLVVIAGSAQDTESDIREITVTLTGEQREWRAVNGAWQMREKSGDAWGAWTTVPASDATFWKKSGAYRVDWSLEMNLEGLPEQQYTVKASARDSLYNSEAQSSQSRVVVYDNTPPVITVLSPTLTTAADDPLENNRFGDVEAALDGKLPGDITWLSELLNDDFEFRWQITDDVSVKDLEIQLADKDGVVYYESTQYDIPRNGSVTIRKDEIYDRKTQAAEPPERREAEAGSPAPLAAREYLQILTKSYDRAGNYEWKRNGWVVWDPESDKPWSTPPQEFGGSPETETEVTAAGTSFLGQAYDDDGVAEVTLSLYRGSQLESGYPITIVADDTPVSFQWSFVPPTVETQFKLESVVIDKNGLSGDTQSAYFRTRIPGDPPDAVLTAPDSNDPLFGDKNGDITFTGYVTDNSAVTCAYIAWIHPDNSPTNRAFRNAGYAGWEAAKTATTPGSSPYVDSASAGSKVWALPYGGETAGGKGKKYDFSLTLNRWTDMAIDTSGEDNFSTQTFVIYVEDDNNSSAVIECATGRDNDQPVAAIQKVRVNSGAWQDITDNLLLPALSDRDTLTLQGEWSDNSISVWEDPQKIKVFKVTWNGIVFHTTQQYAAGKVSWTSEAAPVDSVINGGSKIKDSPAANIRVEIIDLAGNRTVTDESFMVETDVPQLGRITSSNEGGAYKAGDVITVTLEFNKKVTWTQGPDPSLTLTDTNNSSLSLVASYKDGKDTSKINFTYTVGAGVNTTGKLDVKSITAEQDQITSNTKPAIINLPLSGLNSLAGGKTIIIDTTAPTIQSVNALTSAGAYPAGRPLMFTVVTSEPVTVSGSPVLTFSNGQQSDAGVTQTAGNTLMFTLTTVKGKDTTALKVSSLSAGNGITDDAGNPLVLTLPNAGMSGTTPSPVIAIDTEPPLAPTITGVDDNAMYFVSDKAFTLSGLEADRKKAEYTVNNGATWNAYSGTVSLGVNGTYQIKARQTDKADNLSAESALYTVTVDAGNLLTKISSPENDGTYKTGETIRIDVYTRKPIVISNMSVPYIELNVKNNSVVKKLTGVTKASDTQWRFTYTIADGDAFDGAEDALRVTAISAGGATVTMSGVVVTGDFQKLTDIESAMRLENQKKIRILTGSPTITAADLTAVKSGDEYTSATLTLTFNRPVYKGMGNITLTQDIATYIPPAALTPAQYAKAGGAAALGAYYTYGVNGADSSYNPDLTGKYVLNYDKDPSDVKSIFIGKNMHVVTISAASSEVAITNETVVITLSGSYAPPTFGANYTVDIPAGAFKDEFSANSVAYNAQHALGGVNKPVVRVQKERTKLTTGPVLQQNREELWVPVASAVTSTSVSSGDLDSGAHKQYAAWSVMVTPYWQTPGTPLGVGEIPSDSDYLNPDSDWVSSPQIVYRVNPTMSKLQKVGYEKALEKTSQANQWEYDNWIKDAGGDNLEWGTGNPPTDGTHYLGDVYFDPTSGSYNDGSTWATKKLSCTADIWRKYEALKNVYYTNPLYVWPKPDVYRPGPSYYVQYNSSNGWEETEPSGQTDGNRTYIKVTINKGKEVTATTATQPKQASVKIDCQTPNATITYEKSERTDSAGMGIADNTPGNSPWISTFTGGNDAVIRTGLPNHSTSDPSNPSSSPSTPYTIGGTPLKLGGADYDALKVKLIVMAEKGGAKAYAYESANKTVVEFRFTSAASGGDYGGGGGRDIGSGEKLWIQGGDSPSGPSGIPGYPLSWDNTKTGMSLMTGNNESTPAATTWYWVSWEISATTYIGFVAGGTDAASENGNGPLSYNVAIEGWSPYKEAYALYPGEKRVLRSDRCGRGGNVYINGQGRGVFGFTTATTSNRP